MPRSPSGIPSALRRRRDSSAAPCSSTTTPLRLSTSMRITSAAVCRSPRRAACRPRQFAGQGRGARRRDFRTPRTRSPTGLRTSRTWIRPEACPRGRSTWVTSPVTTTFEPKPSRVRNICVPRLGGRVLRLVEDDERVVQRAAAHERERRDLDRPLLEIGVEPVSVEHVVERGRKAAAGTDRPSRGLHLAGGSPGALPLHRGS